MAIVVISELPEGITDEMYDAVNAKLGNEAPEGGIVHTGGRDDSGTFRVVDVWESVEALRKFEDERLRPAIAEVARSKGMDPAQMPAPKQMFYEAHDIMVGSPANA